jgi:flagellar basal-body rod protein FlgB
MPFSFDQILGVHQPALIVEGRRAELLASNLANADTPGYKARDIDFRQALRQQQAPGDGAGRLALTNSRHLQMPSQAGGFDVEYRIPQQPSLDGNTVEQQVEMSAYTENAMRYLATLRFLSGKFNSLRTAIKGQ